MPNNSHPLSTRLLEIAPKLVIDALRIKEGQIVEVTLTGERNYLDILDAFTLTISRAGAFPVIRLNSPSYRRRFMQTVPEKYLMKPPPHMVKWISDIDRHINLVADSPLFNPDHITEKRRQAHMDARKKITGQIRQKNVSNIYLPTRELANYCGISFEVFEQQIINGLDIDYDSVRRNCKRIADTVRGKNKEITLCSGDQLALTCRLADRHVFIEDGRHELPCGMVFFPPLETTVTGSVLIDECSINSNTVKQLLLEFSDGQLIRSDAGSNHRCFIDLLKNSYGDSDVFAGMGIGLNPGLYSMGRNRITDFYMNGSVHISLGANLLYGGTNSSDLFIRLPVYKPDILINGKSLVYGTQH